MLIRFVRRVSNFRLFFRLFLGLRRCGRIVVTDRCFMFIGFASGRIRFSGLRRIYWSFFWWMNARICSFRIFIVKLRSFIKFRRRIGFWR